MTCSSMMRRIWSRKCPPTSSSVFWRRQTPRPAAVINELLKYPEDSAGGVMTTELMELRAPTGRCRRPWRPSARTIDKETINNCYVTDRDRTLIGVVSLRALVLSKDPDNELIRDMMDDNVVSVNTTCTDQE